jgi:pyruvate dehydrogenase E1 component alpha subunit
LTLLVNARAAKQSSFLAFAGLPRRFWLLAMTAMLPRAARLLIDPPAYPKREIAVARPAKKASIPSAPKVEGDIPRPPQPKRWKASKDELMKLYREMLLIRRFEERAGQLYGLGLIGGFCHLYIGQEAVAVGLQSAMTVGKDSVITGYRDHGHMLAYGIDPKLIMAELTGREAGISKGKGGSMHMFSVEHGFYGGHGIVGAMVPLGTGLAFKHKYAEDGGVCLTYMGDGAVNQGQVYEAFNMAKLWNLPIIYAIENNKYAMGTSIERSSSEPLLYRRGESFRIPGIRVDGMDVLAVRGAAEVALEWTRSGKGPIIVEFMTYRYRGHSMSDPAKYRTREEVQDVREHNDPIDHAAQELEKLGVKEEELKAIDKEIKDIVVAAAKFAEDAPEPAPAELYTDVLVESY